VARLQQSKVLQRAFRGARNGELHAGRWVLEQMREKWLEEEATDGSLTRSQNRPLADSE
jgi:hypothetical protein